MVFWIANHGSPHRPEPRAFKVVRDLVLANRIVASLVSPIWRRQFALRAQSTNERTPVLVRNLFTPHLQKRYFSLCSSSPLALPVLFLHRHSGGISCLSFYRPPLSFFFVLFQFSCSVSVLFLSFHLITALFYLHSYSLPEKKMAQQLKPFRSLLEDLYITQNFKLDNIRDFMNAHHSINAG